MASNNNELVFYQQWAVAGLQMDKYSTNPWCVDSKNLDIFSDSQSVKGTAWSTPTQVPSVDYVDVDEKGRFYLLANWNVYDSVNDTTMDHTFFDQNASWLDYWNWTTVTAQYWTPLKLFVAYDWDTWRNITVVTDRTWHTRYNTWVHSIVKQVSDKTSAVWTVDLHWDSSYVTVSINSSTNFQSHRTLPWMTWGRVKMNLTVRGNTNPLEYWHINVINHNLKRDESIKGWKVNGNGTTTTTDFTESTVYEWYVDWYWGEYGQNLQITSKLSNEAYKLDEEFFINEKWDYMLPWEKNFVQIDWTWYMFVPDQNLYEEIDMIKEYDVDGNSYWTIMTAWAFPVREWQEIVALTKTFDYRLVFCNDNSKEVWYVYLVPAWDDMLNFQQAWEFPWLKFINAVMVNGYSYVIADERWVRGLYIFYNWQTKKIVGADTKYTEWESIIDWKQIYNFTWPMLNWRGHVVAPTVNWIYMYWENRYWQNVGSFILKVDWEITSMEAKNNQLKVIYTEWANSYYKIYQDDINIRHYENDWSVTFPVQIGTHLLEKEIRDLELSYFLPNSSTSLDVYVSINDYYFWTFTIANWPTLVAWDTVKLKWAGNAELTFIEKDWNDYTFKLEGNMPYQTSNDKKITVGSTDYVYTNMTHFKKIWRCVLSNPQMKWWKNRIFKITAENELPIVRKMQIRIDWHTDWHNSPLLYSVRLLSSQNDR